MFSVLFLTDCIGHFLINHNKEFTKYWLYNFCCLTACTHHCLQLPVTQQCSQKKSDYQTELVIINIFVYINNSHLCKRNSICLTKYNWRLPPSYHIVSLESVLSLTFPEQFLFPWPWPSGLPLTFQVMVNLDKLCLPISDTLFSCKAVSSHDLPPHKNTSTTWPMTYGKPVV